jgi:hypothetical protein
MSSVVNLKDIVTVSLALLGAVLGIINTVHSLNQNRLKLVVRAKSAYPVFGGTFGQKMGCIEVTNLSAFPVYVSEIGFEIPHATNRLALLQPITTDGLSFARRLESRQSVTGYFQLDNSLSSGGRSYVKTDCNEIAHGNTFNSI